MKRIKTCAAVLSIFACGFMTNPLLAQCTEWEVYTPFPLAHDATDAFYYLDTWYVLFDNGLIQTSANGQAPWSRTQILNDHSTYGQPGARTVAHASHATSMYVVVAENGDIITSPNLSTWSLTETGGPSWADVIWNESYFTAVGENGAVSTSSDGLTWTPKTAPSNDDLKHVVWFDNKLVALAHMKVFISDDNGDSWSEHALPVSMNRIGNDINGDVIIGVGDAGAVATSPDGITWTTRTSPITEDLIDVVFDFVNWHAISQNKVMRSFDSGVTWTERSIPNPGGFTTIGNNGFDQLIAGSDGLIRYSVGNGAWTQTDSGITTTSWSAMAVSPKRHVAAGSSSIIATSSNGEDWTSLDLGGTRNIQDLAWDGAHFVGVDASGDTILSTDGETWEDITATGANAVTGNGDRWVAAASGKIQLSRDGRNWVEINQPDTNVYRDIHWDGFQFIAVGSGGAVKTSADGFIWHIQTTPTGDDLRAVADNAAVNQIDKIYVTVGINRTILRSTDASTWTEVQRIAGETLEAVVWDGTHFYAMGTSFYYTSPDGTTWTENINPAGINSTFTAAHNGFRLLAGAERGALFGQDCDSCDAVTLSDQPLDVLGPEDGTIYLSVKAAGTTPITYQWLYNGSPISGATAAQLALPNMAEADYGAYQCRISNACSQVYSQVAMTDRIGAPLVYTAASSSQACIGDTLVLNISAGGALPLSYQWREDGTDIPGATSSQLTVENFDADHDYTCTVSNASGSALSATQSYTALSPPAITSQPSAQFACQGDDVSFSVSAAGSALTYQWFKDDAPISGAASATLNLTGLAADDFATYKCAVYNSCNLVESTAVDLTEDVAPTLNSGPPASADYCPGDTADLTVDVSSLSAVSYQWRKDGVDIPGATAATLTLSDLASEDGANYTCIITNACGDFTTDNATVIVIEPVATLTQNSFCEGDDLTLSVAIGGNTPTAWQWRLDGVDIAGAISDTFNLSVLSQSDVGDYTCAVTGDCGVQISNALEVRMDEAISIQSQPNGGTVCETDTVNLSVSATGNSLNYQWRLDGVDIAGANAATLNFNATTADAGIYTCRIFNACVSQISSSATLVVNAEVSLSSQPAGSTICSGDAYTFSVTAAGTTPLSYQWRLDGINIAGATAPSYAVTGADSGDAGFYDCVVTNTCGSLISNAAALTVIQTPAFSAGPSSATLCEGDTANLSVSATGTSLTYQWRKDGTDIAGANAATLSFSASASDAGSYTCVINNSCGSLTSSSAELTVNEAATFTLQPIAAEVCAGDPASFSVTVNGTNPLTYQWRKDGVNISGAVSAQYPITAADTDDSGAYDCLVTNPCGTITSSAAALVVTPPPAITSSPVDATLCVGDPLDLTVAATGSALTYQWRRDGVDIAAATNATLNLTAAEENAGAYTCVVSNSCGSQTSTAANITVNTPVAFSSQPQGLSVCPTLPFDLTVTASGTAPVTYQWRKDGVDISGATAATLSVASAAEADAGSYDCIVTNPCGSQTSDTAAVTVDEAVTISGQPNADTVCEGEVVNLSVTASGGSLSYQWRKNSVEVPGATQAAYSFTATADDAGSYTCIITNGCGARSSQVAEVVVNAPVSITSQPQSSSVCSGSDLILTVTASGTSPLTYQWRKDGVNIPGASTASLAITQAASGDAGGYDCVITNLCQSQTSTTAVVAVQEVIAITGSPSSATVCAGEAVNLSVSAAGTAPLYQWQKDGADIPGATSAIYNFTAAESDAGSYACAISNSCGSQTSTAATVSVSSPVSFNQQPQSTSVCTGGPTTLSVNVSGSEPITYQWRKDGVPVPAATSTHLTIGSVAMSDAASYDCVVQNSCGETTSTAAVLSVDESVTITSQPTDTTVCNGEDVTLTVAASGDAPSYQWKKDGADIAGAVNAAYTTTASASDAGVYTCLVSNSCGSLTSSTATLTVNDPVSISGQPTATSACTDSSATFSVTATGTDVLGYQWRKDGVDIAGAVASTLILDNVQNSDAANYDCVVENGCGAVTSTAAALTVDQAVSITSQPTDTTVCAGENATLTITGEGDSPSYQWRKDGVDIPGAVNATLSITAATADAGIYTCAVSNSCGSLTSDSAALTVKEPVSISSQPVDQSTCSDTPVTFSVTAAGQGALTYQWRKDGVNIPGAENPTHTINSPQSQDAGAYDCIIENLCGPLTSNAADLTVVEAVALTQQPSPPTACPDTEVTLTVAATGGDLTYQWRVNDTDIAGETQASLTFTASDDGPRSYTCVVSNSCGSVTSNPADLTIIEAADVAMDAAQDQLCVGDPLALSVTVAGAEPVTLQWRKDGVDIPGATDAAFSIPSVSTDDAGQYDVLFSNQCVSPTATTAVTVTVDEAVTIDTQPVDADVCDGDQVTFSVAASGSGLAYQWRLDNTDIEDATQPTLTLQVDQADEGDYQCVITNNCGQTATNTVTLTIEDPVEIQSQTGDVDTCEGESVTMSVSASGTAPISYQWRKDGVDIPGATNAELTFPTVSSSDSADYLCVVTNACGEESSDAVTLSVDDNVQIQSQTTEVLACSLDTVTMSVTATGSNLNYQWFRDGNLINGATNATFQFTTISQDDGFNFTCRVSNDCDEVETDAIPLQVDTPVAIVSQPITISSCPDDVAVFSVNVTGTQPISYQWRKDGLDIPGATSPTLTLINPNPADEGAYSCFAANDCGSQVSNEAGLVVDGPLEVQIQPGLIAQGNTPITLTANVACAVDAVTTVWRNLDTGVILGTDVLNIVLDPVPVETTTFEVSITDQSSLETTTGFATVLVADNPTYQDPNGDGCNTIEDLYVVAVDWLANDPQDADGNGIINIFDLLYINTQGDISCNDPLSTTVKQ